jgi:hypothetical protein
MAEYMVYFPQENIVLRSYHCGQSLSRLNRISRGNTGNICDLDGAKYRLRSECCRVHSEPFVFSTLSIFLNNNRRLMRSLYCLCVYVPLPTTFECLLETSSPKEGALGEHGKPVVYSGRRALRREQCDMTPESGNSGSRTDGRS